MNEKITILGIDPGNNLGIAICDYHINNNILDVQYTNCYDLNKFINIIIHDDRSNNININNVKFYILKKILYFLNKRFHITLFCAEEGYVNIRFPQAAYSVINNISLLSACVSLISNTCLYTIHNKIIKSVLISGDAKKIDIKKAIFNTENIILSVGETQYKDIHNLTEHEYDAIAVAYAFSTIIKIF